MRANFYVTFGVQYTDRNPHPNGGHADGWVRVVGEGRDLDACENNARDIAWDRFGNKWSMIYSERDWKPDRFPRGELFSLGAVPA